MDKEYLNFLKDAYNGGLCNEYRDEIRRCHEDKLNLVRLAMRQQSIPYIATKMNEGVITKEYLLNAFGDYLNGVVLLDCDNVEGYAYSWFVDWDYNNDISINVDVAHIAWTVGANVVIPQAKCPTIYISNKSDVHLVCDGYNSLHVYLFDDSRVTIDDSDEHSEVVVYKYSDSARIEKGKFCFGKVKIFDKELRL